MAGQRGAEGLGAGMMTQERWTRRIRPEKSPSRRIWIVSTKSEPSVNRAHAGRVNSGSGSLIRTRVSKPLAGFSWIMVLGPSGLLKAPGRQGGGGDADPGADQLGWEEITGPQTGE